MSQKVSSRQVIGIIPPYALNEYSLLHQAADLLSLLIPSSARTPDEIENSPVTGGGRLILEKGGEALHLNVVCKQQLPAAVLPRLISEMRAAQTQSSIPSLLIAPYIPPALTLALREAGIFYLDLKGNLFLRWGEREFWFVQAARALGKQFPAPPSQKVETLTAAGARLVYILLSDPNRINWNYRNLADRAGIAVGTVKMSLDWLRHHEFVRDFGRRGLFLRRILLERWAQAYNIRLRPKLQVGRFEGLGADGSMDILLGKSFPTARVALAGTAAASHLQTEYRASGSRIAYYARDKKALNEFIAHHRLSRSHYGNIELFMAFWRPEDEICAGIAPPLIVYAELLGEASSRAWEAAGMIQQQYLREMAGDD